MPSLKTVRQSSTTAKRNIGIIFERSRIHIIITYGTQHVPTGGSSSATTKIHKLHYSTKSLPVATF